MKDYNKHLKHLFECRSGLELRHKWSICQSVLFIQYIRLKIALQWLELISTLVWNLACRKASKTLF